MNIAVPNYQVTTNFKYTEHGISCSCCQRIRLIPEFYNCMAMIQVMRERTGFPIIFNSGYRCPDRNKAVGGAADSMHMRFAADIRPEMRADEPDGMFELKLDTMYKIAEELGFGGIGRYDMWLHVDTRTKQARWDNRTGARDET